MNGYTLGIDIGGTNTDFGIVDSNGKMLVEMRLSTVAFPTLEGLLEALIKQIKVALNTLPKAEALTGIGIGAPNANYYRGTIEYAPNLRMKGILDLAGMFQPHFDVPIVITNDANAAALGELHFGAAKEMKDFIVITIGTGLGSGIVVNGKLVYGFDGFAGELGHTLIVPEGRLCSCGRNGCLEEYVSARGVQKTVIELLSDSDKPSLLRSLPKEELGAWEAFKAAQKGDALAMETYEETGRILGFALANSVAYTGPEAIFLFGGIAKAGDYLLEPTRRWMEHYLMTLYQGKVKLLLSGLHGKNAGVLGAVALIWDHIKGEG